MNHLTRRHFLATGAAATAALTTTVKAQNHTAIIRPASNRRILLSCKLSMIARETKDDAGITSKLTIVERLKMAAEAGFDGVDFDEAGDFTPEQARDAVRESGVFCHCAINHAHWNMRLTDPQQETRDKARANMEHCIRVSHAIGGSSILIVVGKGGDGPAEEIEERCRQEIKKSIPLAASLGQMILFENVWNQMMYDHDKPAEQGAERFVNFVDSFNSPWVGMYYDIGNHWKYGQPLEWLRQFGRRAVKLDIKGFSRAKNKFTNITSPEDDVPWDKVREGLDEIGFTGWSTAEVGGGDVKRLTTVREQMQKALGA